MTKTENAKEEAAQETNVPKMQPEKADTKTMPKEVGGRVGPEPTRYGDWEKNGIISDF